MRLPDSVFDFRPAGNATIAGFTTDRDAPPHADTAGIEALMG